MNNEKEDLENIETQIPVTAEENTSTLIEDELVTAYEEDFHDFSKEDYLKRLEGIESESKLNESAPILQKLKNSFDQMVQNEKKEHLAEFIANGGVAEDFFFKQDDTIKNFYKVYKEIQSKRKALKDAFENDKNKNLDTKKKLLDKLKVLVDGEANADSLQELKRIQAEWKAVGYINPAQNKTLWASYNVLMDRYYNNRQILLDLLELDRKKNLTLKIALCEKAEHLVDNPNINQALKELGDLHEEFKHIGPVPKEDQEIIWQRFKNASNAIREKKSQEQVIVEEQKKENLKKKEELCVTIEQFATANFNRINDWNDKTKEVLKIQEQWEAIHLVPKDGIKELSKRFWAAFKSFFQKKADYFHKLDESRAENLKQKTVLMDEITVILELDTNPDKKANQIKDIQKKWKLIGPVPIKQRDKFEDQFKKLCDSFFEQRRNVLNESQKVYTEHLTAKDAVCKKIDEFESEALLNNSFEQLVKDFLEEWENAGEILNQDKKDAENNLKNSLIKLAERYPTEDEEFKDELKLIVEAVLIKLFPMNVEKLRKKETAIRNRITKIENEMAVVNNNIGFFAKAKGGNALTNNFTNQLSESQKEIDNLKKQLKQVRNLLSFDTYKK